MSSGVHSSKMPILHSLVECQPLEERWGCSSYCATILILLYQSLSNVSYSFIFSRENLRKLVLTPLTVLSFGLFSINSLLKVISVSTMVDRVLIDLLMTKCSYICISALIELAIKMYNVQVGRTIITNFANNNCSRRAGCFPFRKYISFVRLLTAYTFCML